MKAIRQLRKCKASGRQATAYFAKWNSRPNDVRHSFQSGVI